MPDVYHEGKDIVVSLKNTRQQQSTYTEYANVDLASGYPADEIWTTKDGRRIAIPNMSDQHLLNTIAYLRRRSEDYRKMVIAQIAKEATAATLIKNIFDVPDDVWDGWSQKLEDLKDVGKKYFNMETEALLRTVIPIYQKLLTECYRRKLLLEVDATKLDKSPKPPKQPKAGVKKVKPRIPQRPQDWRDAIDELEQTARECDGCEVPEPLWPAAEHIVKRKPHLFRLGSARGPDKAWKRLYYTGDE